MRNLRFFAYAQNDIVGVGGFRRPDICRLLSVICRLNCHPEEALGPVATYILEILRRFAPQNDNPSASFLGTVSAPASVGASKLRLEVATAGPHPCTGEALGKQKLASLV